MKDFAKPSKSGHLVHADEECVDEHDGERFQHHPTNGRVPLKLFYVRNGQTQNQIHQNDRHVKHENHENDSGHPVKKVLFCSEKVCLNLHLKSN